MVEANTIWLTRKHSETITEGWVTDTSYIFTLRTPASASLLAMISAAFWVWPYTEA